MALTLTKEPEVISLSKDPMVFEFQTDNMVVSAGTAAVNKITFTSGVAVDDVIVISWAGQELRMVAKAVPVLSNEFLAGTSDLNVLLPYFRDNYTIEKDFVVSIVSGKIDLTARAAGTKYNIDDVTFTGGSITTTVAGVNSVVRKNFGVYFEVWVQKADGTDAVKKIHDDVIPVDRATSKVDVDISQVLHSELSEDLPWEFVANAGVCAKSKRKYYIRYAEVFGEKTQVQRLVLGATKHVMMGGSSLIGRKTVLQLLQGGSASADACLRIGDTTRYILAGEEQYLYFLATRANVEPVLQATITYSDASTEVKYGLGYGAERYAKVYFRASLAVFEPNVSKTVVQYVVKVVDVDNANVALSKAYTFVIDYSVRKSVRNFFYVNSLGAVDEFATFGKGSREIEYYKDSAEKAVTDLGIEAQEEDYNIESREVFEAATGFRSRRELAYMRDFFLSSRKYVKNLGKWLPIILATKRVKEAEDGQNLNGYKFEYSLAYKDDSLSDSDLSEIIGYPLPPQGFLGGGNVTISITEPAGIIIDAVPTLGSSNAVSSNGVAVALEAKQDLIALGTELQYIRGDGTLGILGNEVSLLGGSVFEDKWAAKNNATNLALGYGSGNIAIGNFGNDSLTKILGRFGLQNAAGFLGQFSVSGLTANRIITFPDRNIEVNNWADLSGVPSLLGAFATLTGTGVIRKTGTNSFSVGTNDPITLSGAVTGTGTTSIVTTLADSGVDAGTYRSVTVNSKGIIVNGSNPTTISGYGITDFASRWNDSWLAKNNENIVYLGKPTGKVQIQGIFQLNRGDGNAIFAAPSLLEDATYSFPNFSIEVNNWNSVYNKPTTISGYGITADFDSVWNAKFTNRILSYVNFGYGIGIENSFILKGEFYDKNMSVGSANQVLTAITGGVAWASLSTTQISNFSSSVLGQLLTGLATGSNAAISASNTILTAFQNLQAQITNKTTAEKLVFGVGYLQNSDSGFGFKYKPSTAGNSPIPNTNYYTGEIDFSKISQNRKYEMPNYDGILTTYEKVSSDFWKIGGNLNISQDAIFDIQSKYTIDGSGSVQDPPYNYLWRINGQSKMQLTPQGNLSVGGIAPEAVIHAHATVIGNAEVIALKASNNVNSAYFSIGIDSTNNRTSFYAGGEVWATTISKFKFGAADISGIWNFSVVPQATADAILGNQLVRLSQVQSLLSGGFAISTACKLVFVDNQSLSGAKTQGGYTTVSGDNILLTGQSTTSQNGVYVFDGTNWARNTANDTDTEIRNKGHLITNGSYASTQWVNNNASVITVGTTAITYVQWSGAELDPVWESYKNTNDLTPTRFGNWNTAYGWGNHAGLYVDKTTAQNNIAGAKVFTTSIQSPIVRAGTDALNITMFNYFGASPRIASNASLDFFATSVGGFSWTTTGDFGQMRLTTSGLYVGGSTAPSFRLQVAGTVGFGGLISVVNAITGTYSSGSDGQFLKRKSVSGLNYNEWSSLSAADISDLGTNYQTKLNGTGFVEMNGTTLTYRQFSEFGKYLYSYNNFNVTDAPFGASFVGGLSTGLPNGYYVGHSIKMAVGQDKPNDFTLLAFGLPNQSDFDGKIYARGYYDGVYTDWKPLGGDIADFTVYRGEAETVLRGYYYNNLLNDKAFFAGYNRTTGEFEFSSTIAVEDSTSVKEYRTFIDIEGRLNFQLGDNIAKRYLLEDEVSGGTGSLTYTATEPIYFSGANNNVINVRTASVSQAGVLSATDYQRFESAATGNINFGTNRAIYFRGTGITDPNDFAGKLSWVFSTPVTTPVFTGVQGIILESVGNMNVGATNDLNLKGNKVIMNGIELSMAKVAALLAV